MKAAPNPTVPSAKAALRKGTWSRKAPLELLGDEAEVEELLEGLVEEPEVVVALVEDLEEVVEGLEEVVVEEEPLMPELEVDEFDAVNVRCK